MKDNTATDWKLFVKQACERQLQHEEDEAMAIEPGSFMSAEELEAQHSLLMQRLQGHKAETEVETVPDISPPVDSSQPIQTVFEAGRHWLRLTAEGLKQIIAKLEPDDTPLAVGYRSSLPRSSTPIPSQPAESAADQTNPHIRWKPTQEPRAFQQDCFRFSLKYVLEPIPEQVPEVQLTLNGQEQAIERLDYRKKFGMLHIIVHGAVPTIKGLEIAGSDADIVIRLTV